MGIDHGTTQTCRLTGGGFCLFANHDDEVAPLAFLGVPQVLDLVEGGFVQVQELAQYVQASCLAADYLDRRIFQDGGSKRIRSLRGAREVLNRLRYAPNAADSFAGGSVELHHQVV